MIVALLAELEHEKSSIFASDGVEEDVDVRGASNRTALHRAAGGGHTKCVQILLNLGASKTLQTLPRFLSYFYRCKFER